MIDQIHSQMFFLLFKLSLSYFVKKSPLHKAQQLIGFHQYADAKAILDEIFNETQIFNPQFLLLRAKCSLHLNLTDLCLTDINNLLKSNITEAQKREAYDIQSRLYLRYGQIDLAEKYALLSKSNQTIQIIHHVINLQKQFTQIFQNNQLYESASIINELLDFCPLNELLILNCTEIYWKLREYVKYLHYANDFETKYPNNSKVYFRKGIIHLCNLSFFDAITYLNHSLQLKNTESYLALNLTRNIINIMRNIEKAYNNSDIDLMSKSLSLLNSSSFEYCSENDRLVQTVYLYQIRFLRLEEKYSEAFEYLDKFIFKYPNSPEFVLEKADLDLALNNYDAAIELYNIIKNEYNADSTQEKIDHANLMKRKSFFIDYYAFLGLKRDDGNKITIETIKESYKKVVRHWHPDCFSNSEKKAEAERIMKFINAAYDILSDPKKKELYDKGLNPYHPDSEYPETFSDKFVQIISSPDFSSNKDSEGPLHITIEL